MCFVINTVFQLFEFDFKMLHDRAFLFSQNVQIMRSGIVQISLCVRNESESFVWKKYIQSKWKEWLLALWQESQIFINLKERGGKKSDTNASYKRTDQITAGRKANLLIRSLKYKLQEARTFWWTSNSLPSTIIFRSVNSFALRCWFNSFNISAEQRRQTVPGFPLRDFFFKNVLFKK